MKVYLVGGAVRDELLGHPVSDRDWVVIGATPQEMLDQGFLQIGNAFPCFLHPETKEEYALARTERKSGKGHTALVSEFGVDITLEEDLSRRDLTINAIAKKTDGEYVDPFGGRADIKARILRHVSDAFADDPLRVLRVARFAARYAAPGFKVHDDTLALMREMVNAGEVSDLTPERVWKEISRALNEPKPSTFFKVLRSCDALKVLLPELDKLFGVPQPAKHHPEIDTGEHVMMVIDIAKQRFNTPIVTWAALLHDLGKGLTPEDEWPSHLRHESQGVPLAAAVSDRFKVPRDYRDLAMLVTRHHLRCHRLLEMRPKSVMRLIEAVDGVRRPKQLAHFVQACEADARGRLGLEESEYPQSELLLGCGAAAKQVDITPLLDHGYEGLKLAEQIRQLRISAIRSYLSK